MWWSEDVAGAVKTCQLQKSVLVVLVEPSADMLKKHAEGAEASKQTLSRVATSSMHRITFAQPAVTRTIRDSRAVCLKFPNDESNAGFKAFSVYFKLQGNPPNIYFISPLTGQTLVHKSSYVSPKSFLESLAATTKVLSGRVLSVPDVEPPMSAAQSAASETMIAAMVDEQFGPTDERDSVGLPQPDMAKPISDGSVDKKPAESASTNVSVQSASSVKSMPGGSESGSMKLPRGTKKESGVEARLLARLPGGGQAQKNFPANTRFSVVRSWVSEEVASAANAVVISTAFPRRVFDLGDDPKMLSELGLVPSETLIVAMSGGSINSAPRGRVGNAPTASGLRGYAIGALGIVSGFFRSFVADVPAADPARQEEARLQTDQIRPLGSIGRQGPSAMRIDRPRLNRPEVADDENLLSNGNSTQYGWNPRDEEEDQS